MCGATLIVPLNISLYALPRTFIIGVKRKEPP